MITNERQYRITRSKASSFAHAIEEFEERSDERRDVHSRLQQAELEGMKSQLTDLQGELEEYERLKSADLSVISGASFEDLAIGLIKARIARKLSQRALAQRLKLKEQQIQRYEAERYVSASYKRLCEIARALEVRIENKILLPAVSNNFEKLLEKISQAGLSREFLVGRLLSSADAAFADGEVPGESSDQILTERAAVVLERVFGWRNDEIFGKKKLSAPTTALTRARFKIPKRHNEKAARLFATYAGHLAAAAIRGMADCPIESIPTDPGEMRKRILDRSGAKDDLRTVLHAVWDLGVVVLPLRGKGTFHGACWRSGGRNAIVLKQTSKSEERWMFDLLHELFHAAQQPEEESFELLEAEMTSSEYRESDEEIAANEFAGNVMLDGRADDLAQDCLEQARNKIQKLQNVVPKAATRHGVSAGALANYLAFRLSRQGKNWWGAATKFQRDDNDPWTTARDVFVERYPYRLDDEIDCSLLDRALN